LSVGLDAVPAVLKVEVKSIIVFLLGARDLAGRPLFLGDGAMIVVSEEVGGGISSMVFFPSVEGDGIGFLVAKGVIGSGDV